MSPRLAEPFSVEHALLGFLREEPLHGYELYQRLETADDLSRVWRLKQAHLYALLGKLEAAGLIESEVVPQEGRPPRRVLRLTPDGAAAFDAWVRAPVAHGRDLRIEFLAKLFWAQRLGEDRARELIASQRVACEGWLSGLQHERERAGDEGLYASLVLEFRLTQTVAMLAWLDRCADVLLVAV